MVFSTQGPPSVNTNQGWSGNQWLPLSGRSALCTCLDDPQPDELPDSVSLPVVPQGLGKRERAGSDEHEAHAQEHLPLHWWVGCSQHERGEEGKQSAGSSLGGWRAWGTIEVHVGQAPAGRCHPRGEGRPHPQVMPPRASLGWVGLGWIATHQERGGELLQGTENEGAERAPPPRRGGAFLLLSAFGGHSTWCDLLWSAEEYATKTIFTSVHSLHLFALSCCCCCCACCPHGRSALLLGPDAIKMLPTFRQKSPRFLSDSLPLIH